MLTRATVAVTMLLIAATGVSAQRAGMHAQRADSTPAMMGQDMMMMRGMMGQGMMGQHMMMMMGRGMGMMATGGPGPAALLRIGDALELSDQQRGRLEEIQDETAADAQGHMYAAMAAHREAAEALQPESPDFDAYERALREAADHMVVAHTLMAKVALESREVLTPEQREQLQRGMHMMGQMMGGPGAGGGMGR